MVGLTDWRQVEPDEPTGDEVRLLELNHAEDLRLEGGWMGVRVPPRIGMCIAERGGWKGASQRRTEGVLGRGKSRPSARRQILRKRRDKKASLLHAGCILSGHAICGLAVPCRYQRLSPGKVAKRPRLLNISSYDAQTTFGPARLGALEGGYHYSDKESRRDCVVVCGLRSAWRAVLAVFSGCLPPRLPVGACRGAEARTLISAAAEREAPTRPRPERAIG